MNKLDVGNGIYLKYIGTHIIGASGNWWESRLRIYDGVNIPPGEHLIMLTIIQTFLGMMVLVNVIFHLPDKRIFIYLHGTVQI